MQKKFIVIFLVLSSLQSVSQKLPKLGKISKEHFEVTSPLLDSSPDAVVLFDIGSLKIEYNQSSGWGATLEKRVAIKILNEDGLRYATQIIKTNDQLVFKEKVSSVKGYTYPTKGAKPTKLNKYEMMTEEKITSQITLQNFDFPDVQVGSIIEFKYAITSDNLINPGSWEFQKEIPVLYSEFTTEIPQFFQYITLIRGDIQLLKNENEVLSESIRLTERQRLLQANINTQTISNPEYRYNVNKQKLFASELPALKVENQDYTRDDQLSIDFELQITNYPVEEVDYRSNWTVFNKYFLDNPNFGLAISQAGDIINIDGNSKEDQIESAFNQVKENVRWNGFNDIYTENTLRRAFNKGTGNTADINLLLVAALSKNGHNAYPVLLSTKENGEIKKFLPVTMQFNYVICAVEFKDTLIFLDASEKSNAFGELSDKCMIEEGWMVTPEGGKWVKLASF